MNIFACFRSTRVNTLPSYEGSQIADSTNKFLRSLRHIQNSAVSKGGKVAEMYKDTEYYATKLIKHAEKNKFNAAYKDLMKLDEIANQLLSAVNNVYNKDVINSAKLHLSCATYMLGENSIK